MPRRPTFVYDVRRGAWVTRTGGKLKTLCTGPKNRDTERQAREAFHRHLHHLHGPGDPEAVAERLSLGELADQFDAWLEREVAAGRNRPATRAYYRSQLQSFLDAVGGRRAADAITPLDVEQFKTTWHSVQVVRRLYNWGRRVKLVTTNPAAEVERPALGERERILTPHEMARLLRAADKHFRPYLLALRHTLARPGEIRAARWGDVVMEPHPAILLRDYKAKRRRKAANRQTVRVIPLDDRMVRLLDRLARRSSTEPTEPVWRNRFGKPWTANAVRCRMRRLREKVGLGPDDNGEQIVAYSLRHTGATAATGSGVSDRTLADLMGHTSTETTARYQHLQAQHLAAAVRRIRHRGQ